MSAGHASLIPGGYAAGTISVVHVRRSATVGTRYPNSDESRTA